MDRIETLASFARVVETGSLSAAATALDVSLATVSRHIAALERQLGVCLIVRTTRSLALTDCGKAYYERIKRILGDLEEADMQASCEREVPAGHLTVSAPLLLGRTHVVPLADGFLGEQPGVLVSLSLTDRYADLVADHVDIAVRIGELRDSSHIARRVGTFRRILCASPQYLARRGTPATVSDLESHECIPCTLFPGADEWQLHNGAKTMPALTNGRFRCDNLEATIEAAERGAGIALVAPWSIREQLHDGRLRPVLPRWRQAATPINAVYAHKRRLSAKTRAFVDYIARVWSEEDFDRIEPPGNAERTASRSEEPGAPLRNLSRGSQSRPAPSM